MNCLSNIAVVSWTGSAGAEFYTATVTREDGQSASCWSDSQQCGMPNVLCGQNYTVTVVASNEKCNSEPSEADSLQSGKTLGAAPHCPAAGPFQYVLLNLHFCSSALRSHGCCCGGGLLQQSGRRVLERQRRGSVLQSDSSEHAGSHVPL